MRMRGTLSIHKNGFHSKDKTNLVFPLILEALNVSYVVLYETNLTN